MMTWWWLFVARFMGDMTWEDLCASRSPGSRQSWSGIECCMGVHEQQEVEEVTKEEEEKEREREVKGEASWARY